MRISRGLKPIKVSNAAVREKIPADIRYVYTCPNLGRLMLRCIRSAAAFSGSAKAEDRMRGVGLLERGDLCGGEVQREGGDGVLEVIWFGGADDGGGDSGLAE